MALIEQWVAVAREVGVFRFVLPFLLTFIIVYMVLDKLGDRLGGNDRVNATVALIIALFMLGYTATTAGVGQFYITFFTALSVLLVGLFGVVLVVGLAFRGRLADWDDTVKTGLAALGGLVTLLAFVWSGGLAVIFPGDGPGPVVVPGLPLGDVVGLIAILFVLGLIAWAFTGESGSDSDQQQQPQPQ